MNLESQNVGNGMTAPVRDFFAQLQLERRYAVDKSDLEKRYLDRSKQVHPDRFVNAEASQRIAALSASMELNEAYKVLKNDRARAEHLLTLYGTAISSNEQLDPTFLMAILEARESLADAQAKGDTAEVTRLEEGMLDRKDEAMATVAALFAGIEAGQETSPRLAQIKRELIVLRYVERYLEASADEID